MTAARSVPRRRTGRRRARPPAERSRSPHTPSWQPVSRLQRCCCPAALRRRKPLAYSMLGAVAGVLEHDREPLARNASAVAADVIRAAIVDGRLEPGRRLKEEELARELGISRTPGPRSAARPADGGSPRLRPEPRRHRPRVRGRGSRRPLPAARRPRGLRGPAGCHPRLARRPRAAGRELRALRGASRRRRPDRARARERPLPRHHPGGREAALGSPGSCAASCSCRSSTGRSTGTRPSRS